MIAFLKYYKVVKCIIREIQSHLIHSIRSFHSLSIHNCFTAAADNNLNPLLSINNYCNSSKTNFSGTPYFLFDGQLLKRLGCGAEWGEKGISPISHRRQSTVGSRQSTVGQSHGLDQCQCRCRIVELFIFIEMPPDKKRQIDKQTD